MSKSQIPEKERLQARREMSSLGSGILDAITLGSYPKIRGGISAAAKKIRGSQESFGDIYSKKRDKVRRQEQELLDENPGTALVGQFLGGMALPVAGGIKGAKNISRMAASLGGYGAASSIAHRDRGPTLSLDDAIAGLYGAGLGAGIGATGAAATRGAKYLQPHLNNVVKKVFRQDIPVLGKHVSNIELNKKYQTPLTAGEVLQDPKLLKKEYNAAAGNEGANSEKFMSDLRGERSSLFKQDVDDVLRRVGGETSAKGVNLKRSVDSVVDDALQKEKEISNLYQVATQEVGEIPVDVLRGFENSVINAFKKTTLSPGVAPKTYSLVNSLEGFVRNNPGKKIPFNELEAWRQAANKMVGRAEPQERTALLKMIKVYDSFLDSKISTLASSNKSALDAFKAARSAKREWHNKYTPKRKKESAKSFISDQIERKKYGLPELTAEEMSAKIFGAGEGGISPKNSSTILQMKNNFPGIFDSIKQETTARVLSPLTMPGERIGTYKTNLHKFKSQNHTLSKAIYSKEDMKELEDIGRLGELAFTRHKLPENPSGTAAAMSKKSKTYLSKMANWIIPGVERHTNPDFIEKLAKKPDYSEGFGARKVVPNILKASTLLSTSPMDPSSIPKSVDQMSLEEIDNEINALESADKSFISPGNTPSLSVKAPESMSIDEIDEEIKRLESE